MAVHRHPLILPDSQILCEHCEYVSRGIVMKTKVLSYQEIEEIFQDILMELSRDSRDDELLIEKGGELIVLLELCISQMKGLNSRSYPAKTEHLTVLENALAAITYKFNTCTVDEISAQVPAAYRAFGVQ